MFSYETFPNFKFGIHSGKIIEENEVLSPHVLGLKYVAMHSAHWIWVNLSVRVLLYNEHTNRSDQMKTRQCFGLWLLLLIAAYTAVSIIYHPPPVVKAFICLEKMAYI